jgi:hypothetical protein
MAKPIRNKRFPFAPTHKALREVLVDHNLASLGDAYTNLIYSLYLSAKKGKPAGAKTGSLVLSKAVKHAELRKFLPSRLDRHKLADAAEALLVYVWLRGLTSITEIVEEMIKHEDIVEAFSFLLSDAAEKLSL